MILVFKHNLRLKFATDFILITDIFRLGNVFELFIQKCQGGLGCKLVYKLRDKKIKLFFDLVHPS